MKNRKLKFSCVVPFYTKASVCLKYLAHDCRPKPQEANENIVKLKMTDRYEFHTKIYDRIQPMSWQAPLAPLGGQNTILIFSNFGVFIPQKSIMGCPNRWLLSKLEIFYRPEWTKGGTTSKSILTIFKYKNECYKQLARKKLMKKKWGHLSSFYVSFLSYGL